MNEAQGQSPSDWVIRRGNDEYRAPDAGTVREWMKEGRVRHDDLVWHQSFGDSWQRAGDVQEFREAVGIRPGLKPITLMALIMGAIFTFGFLSCAGLMFLGSINSEGTKSVFRSASEERSPNTGLTDAEYDRDVKEQKFVQYFEVGIKGALSRKLASSESIEESRMYAALLNDPKQAARKAGQELVDDMSSRELDRYLANPNSIIELAEGSVDNLF